MHRHPDTPTGERDPSGAAARPVRLHACG